MKTFLVLVFSLLVIAHVTLPQEVSSYVAAFKKQSQDSFAIFDKDKSGYIDAAEIEAVSREQYQKLGDDGLTDEEFNRAAELLITIHDGDGDGKVNFDEYYLGEWRLFGFGTIYGPTPL